MRGSVKNFARSYDCAKPIRSAGGRAGGYRGAAEKHFNTMDEDGAILMSSTPFTDVPTLFQKRAHEFGYQIAILIEVNTSTGWF
jgi:hypothetical protein